MSRCSYCGRENDGAATACSSCGTPVETEGCEDGDLSQTPGVTCPNCGARDNYTKAVELRSSFNLGTFLLGGIFAVMFRNASQPRRVRCNQCDTFFSIRTRAGNVSRAVFWLLVAPAILSVCAAIYIVIRTVLRG